MKEQVKRDMIGPEEKYSYPMKTRPRQRMSPRNSELGSDCIRQPPIDHNTPTAQLLFPAKMAHYPVYSNWHLPSTAPAAPEPHVKLPWFSPFPSTTSEPEMLTCTPSYPSWPSQRVPEIHGTDCWPPTREDVPEEAELAAHHDLVNLLGDATWLDDAICVGPLTGSHSPQPWNPFPIRNQAQFHALEMVLQTHEEMRQGMVSVEGVGHRLILSTNRQLSFHLRADRFHEAAHGRGQAEVAQVMDPLRCGQEHHLEGLRSEEEGRHGLQCLPGTPRLVLSTRIN